MIFRLAKATMLISSILLVVVPALAHRRDSPRVVVTSRRGLVERTALGLVSIAFLLTLIWIVFPILSFANYRLHPVAFLVGSVGLGFGIWLLYRSHADLGDSWSITLEVREKHELRTSGIYGSIRHPMYAALLLYAVGQALVLPNWLVGPSYLVSILSLVASRLKAEERMMVQEFGARYEAYVAQTKRLVPRVW